MKKKNKRNNKKKKQAWLQALHEPEACRADLETLPCYEKASLQAALCQARQRSTKIGF